jgi:hypothetical protein
MLHWWREGAGAGAGKPEIKIKVKVQGDGQECPSHMLGRLHILSFLWHIK